MWIQCQCFFITQLFLDSVSMFLHYPICFWCWRGEGRRDLRLIQMWDKTHVWLFWEVKVILGGLGSYMEVWWRSSVDFIFWALSVHCIFLSPVNFQHLDAFLWDECCSQRNLCLRKVPRDSPLLYVSLHLNKSLNLWRESALIKKKKKKTC